MDFGLNFLTHVARATTPEALRIRQVLTRIRISQKYYVHTLDRDSVYLAHYPLKALNSEKLEGSAKTLTFLNVGSNSPVNVSKHVHSCKSISFSGHLCGATAILKIVKQLHRLEDLEIFVGPSQGHFYLEDPKKSHWCPSVKTLKISVDLAYFENLSRSESGIQMQKCIIYLLSCFLLSADGSFPNLEKLVLELPRDQTLHNVVHHLIEYCPRLRKYVTADSQQIPDPSDAVQLWNISAL